MNQFSHFGFYQYILISLLLLDVTKTMINHYKMMSVISEMDSTGKHMTGRRRRRHGDHQGEDDDDDDGFDAEETLGTARCERFNDRDSSAGLCSCYYGRKTLWTWPYSRGMQSCVINISH